MNSKSGSLKYLETKKSRKARGMTQRAIQVCACLKWPKGRLHESGDEAARVDQTQRNNG